MRTGAIGVAHVIGQKGTNQQITNHRYRQTGDGTENHRSLRRSQPHRSSSATPPGRSTVRSNNGRNNGNNQDDDLQNNPENIFPAIISTTAFRHGAKNKVALGIDQGIIRSFWDEFAIDGGDVITARQRIADEINTFLQVQATRHFFELAVMQRIKRIDDIRYVNVLSL